MKIAQHLIRLGELFRYYQAGLINMAFGFSLYATLVAVGLNIYAAQIVSHVLGVAFNYFTYSRHVFRNSGPSKMRFVASYGINYLLSAAGLALVSLWIKSPYLAGFIVLINVSLLNYFLLKNLVFSEKKYDPS
jgi:putative flippase GtrA